MIILLNSSKTMVSAPARGARQRPVLFEDASALASLLKTMDADGLRKLMHLSPKLAGETHALVQAWSETGKQTMAIDAFQGDIYRGLQAGTLDDADRDYANQHVRILSGLYGVLRPFDLIQPYRLELMYGLSGAGFRNLYEFWGDKVAATLPKRGPIFDLASEEYSRLVRPFVTEHRIVEPEFLTRMTAEAEPTFVAVHAKVARGTLARWMVTHRVQTETDLALFDGMDYQFDRERSAPSKPVFVRVGPWSAMTAKKSSGSAIDPE